jgi:hypothetical protein
MSQQATWRTYEEVAGYLLGQLATYFGLGTVEGKQLVAGRSGTSWEIDAKGVKENDQSFVVIECRRRTTQGLSQEHLAGLAFRIQDTGAAGGIVVSPLPLQSGARKIATSAQIHEVQLSAKSSTTDYVLQFLNCIFIGVSDGAIVRDSVEATVIPATKPE